MAIKSTAWARNEPAARTISKTQRLLVLDKLQQMQVLTTVESKAEVAKFFGISRWTLDRDLAALEKAQAQAQLALAMIFNLRVGRDS